LTRISVGEMIPLSIPPSSENIPNMFPPIQVTNQLSGQLEDLLKKKVKQAPNLLCLYRCVFFFTLKNLYYTYRIFYLA
jgi:hypothetical protein